MKLIIKNGTIINPVHHQHEKGDVVIEDGKIVSLGGIADVPGAEVYDAEGFFVTPGLIDMHVHLREPGQRHRLLRITGKAHTPRPQDSLF